MSLPGASLAPAALTLALLASLASPHTSAAQQAPIRLENGRLRVGFDPRDGRLVEFADRRSGQSFVTARLDTLGVWDLHVAGRDSGAARRVRPADARRFRWSRLGGGAAPALRLTWDDFRVDGVPEAKDLRVTATVRLRADAALSEWRIRLDGAAGVGVDSVRFPRLGGVPSLGGDGAAEELAVPQWMGQRTREPRRLLAGPEGRGRRLEWFYPGQLSLQAIALYRSGGPGLYLAADDSLAYRKSFALWGAPDGTAGYEMVHLPADPGRAATYEPR